MKDNKKWEEYSIQFSIKHGNRKDLRKEIVDKFLEENPGYWKDGIKYVTKYKYFVESLADGKRIYLLRPTFLNKGIDFQVWVERFEGNEDKRPSHKDVIEDIKIKMKENPQQIPELMKAIEEVWNCKEPDEVLKNYKFNFKKGFSVELLLKILKWLFIEQDITYWNYDGRKMLFDAIKKESQ